MKYQINEIVQGTITRILPYGAMMIFEDETMGLLHISEISNNYIKNIYHYLKIGAVYQVKILNIDEEKNFLKVTLKGLSDEERHQFKGLNDRINEKIDSKSLFDKLTGWIELELGRKIDNTKENIKTMLTLSLDHLIEKIDFSSYKEKVKNISSGIREKKLEGNDFLGWLNYPISYDRQELELIIEKAKYVREHFDALVVCGIGGSYLGALAAIKALNGLYPDDKFEIIFLGQTFSPNYISQVLKRLEDKNFAINVISKSGTTTETSISFRLLKQLLIRKVGKENAKNAIFATTDKEKGALKQESIKEGYTTFTLPSDIGGRYSVLTAVGLFPIACANINVKEMLSGAEEAMKEFDNDDLDTNKCYQYAVTRDYLYRHNKQVEMFVTYEPHLRDIAEWFKQLFGESEGKSHKGLLPASATFSTDLHSLGQFIQDGSPILFETLLYIKNPKEDVTIPHDEDDLDGLNYIENKKLSYVNEKAHLGTLDAHVIDGKVNNIILYLDVLNAHTLGYLFYFFMKACAMSAYLLEVNPFNQPGVEVYKKNMFHLLGKKGY